MCQDCNGGDTRLDGHAGLLGRRPLLQAGALGIVTLGIGGLTAAGVALGPASAQAATAPDPRLLVRTPRVLRRATWAGGSCPVRGPLPVERAGDVKFLLVHHTEKPGNRYTADQVPSMMRGMYRFHVGPEKRWADLAYNFVVDKYGRIWEGRTGSMARPVIPGATGGSQGFDQLCCFLGDHARVTPTPAAQASMISLLACLARRYRIDTRPGATTTFVSRGSSRVPRGKVMRTRTIEGHRVMSLTTCPGDAAYALVRNSFPAAVSRLNGLPLGRP